jgi:hypothetical protein
VFDVGVRKAVKTGDNWEHLLTKLSILDWSSEVLMSKFISVGSACPSPSPLTKEPVK